MDKPTITQQIREALIASGISQYRLSKETGIPQPRLSKFFSGNGLHSDNLDRLAVYLGITIKIPKNSQKST